MPFIKVMPKFFPWDQTFVDLLSVIPKGQFRLIGSPPATSSNLTSSSDPLILTTVQYSAETIPFILSTDAWDLPVTVTVNGEIQFQDVPTAPRRRDSGRSALIAKVQSFSSLAVLNPDPGDITFVQSSSIYYRWSGSQWLPIQAFDQGGMVILNPSDPLGFHVETTVPLKLGRGANTIIASFVNPVTSNTEEYHIRVVSVSWATALRAFAKFLFLNVLYPLQEQESALISPWSPRFIENLLAFQGILPDIRSPKTHAVKMAVYGMIANPATEGGVRDFATALSYNNPIIREITPDLFPEINFNPVSRQDALTGFDFHMWSPSRDLARWLVFAKLCENISSEFKLIDHGFARVIVEAEGPARRVEEHIFTEAILTPDFYHILRSFPRINWNLVTYRRVRRVFGINFYTYGLNNIVRNPLGLRTLTGSRRLDGTHRLGTNDGVDQLHSTGWLGHGLMATRFAGRTSRSPIGTMTGWFRPESSVPFGDYDSANQLATFNLVFEEDTPPPGFHQLRRCISVTKLSDLMEIPSILGDVRRVRDQDCDFWFNEVRWLMLRKRLPSKKMQGPQTKILLESRLDHPPS